MNIKDENYSFPTWIKLTLCTFALVLLFSAIFIIFKYATSLTDGFIPDYPNRDVWGVFGDFFGGVLNPIFGFASFLALLATIFYQAKELNASTKELRNSATALAAQNKAIEQQSFEQTFFSWLNTYRDLINSVSGNSPKEILSGRKFLYYLWETNLSEDAIVRTMFNSDYYGMPSNTPREDFFDLNENNFNNVSSYKRVEIISNRKPKESTSNILIIWAHVYRKDEYQLDSIFRTLYRLITWIDSQPQDRISMSQKWLYISIVRSQLSWIEMTFLYYNGLSQLGNKFRPLIEKYALFDNLAIESDIGMKVLNSHLSAISNYKNQAFNSELAGESLGLK